jgi:hypothetical protein
MSFGKLGAMGRGMGHLGSLGRTRTYPENNAVLITGTSLAYGQASTGQGTDTGGLAGLINNTSGYIAHQIGYPGQNSTYCVDHWLTDGVSYRTWTTLFWIAANNVGQVSTVLADLARAVAALGHSRYLVLLEYPSQISTTNGTFATYGTLDDAIKAAYPNNYFDTRVNFATKAPGVPEDAYVADGPDPGLHPNDTGFSQIFTSGGDAGTGLIAAIAALPASPADTTPNAFSFTAATGVIPSTTSTSNTVEISGINTSTAISVSGGEYQVNGGSWVSTAGTIVNGDTVAVRGTASASLLTTTNVVLTIGGGSGSYSITTANSNELVSNGGFDTDTVWTKTNTTIAGGVGVFSAANFGNVRQTISMTAGKTYRVRFTVASYTAGGVRIRLFGSANTDGTNRTAAGTYTEDLVAPASPTSFRVIGSTSSDTLTVDNVSMVLMN